MNIKGKTLIGVIASHDSKDRNNNLVKLLEKFILTTEEDVLKNYSFVFTGGTYDRVILGHPGKRFPFIKVKNPVNETTYKKIFESCGIIRLDSGKEGGVTLLSDLVVKRYISILWFYLSPITHHWLIPENLALMRLCDQWHVKKMMTKGSILEWINNHTKKDQNLNPIRSDKIEYLTERKIKLKIRDTEDNKRMYDINEKPEALEEPKIIPRKEQTIALISHDAMKNRILDFAIYYQDQLDVFDKIITTGTTGKMIEDAIPKLKIRRRHSGPKGGDIEIAAEILRGNCHVVVFFIDPLNPHPHIDDIRNVFAACMMNDNVHMITNEIHAREWFETELKRR